MSKKPGHSVALEAPEVCRDCRSTASACRSSKHGGHGRLEGKESHGQGSVHRKSAVQDWRFNVETLHGALISPFDSLLVGCADHLADSMGAHALACASRRSM